jgi:hypothetical protein
MVTQHSNTQHVSLFPNHTQRLSVALTHNYLACSGAFVCGLGVGVYYDSEVVLSPQNLSSTQLIDRGSPNSDVCMAYGYSSSVFDMKLYVTYNPFNVSESSDLVSVSGSLKYFLFSHVLNSYDHSCLRSDLLCFLRCM